MRSRTMLALLLAAVATLPTSAAAAAEIRQFDVAGVRLGMTPAEARAALTATGLSVRAEEPSQPSWEAQVSQKVAERRQIDPDRTTVPRFTVAKGPRQERVKVWYRAMPEGPRASEVRYTIPGNQMTVDAFRQAAIGKFGAADYDHGWSWLWCSAGEAACRPLMVIHRPSLAMETSAPLYSLTLTDGDDQRQARRDALAAEVEKRAPRDAAASF